VAADTAHEQGRDDLCSDLHDEGRWLMAVALLSRGHNEDLSSAYFGGAAAGRLAAFERVLGVEVST
jgi:hypothetical protein